MPRISAENRSASVFRAGGKHPEPPKGISPRAKRIWRDIVTSKPFDWFEAGSLVLLRSYCVIAADAQELEERSLEVGVRSEAVMESLRRSALAMTTIATKLRLTVQSSLDRRSGQKDEKGPAKLTLIGGRSVT